MEGQEGAFKARKGTLSLDFSSRKPLLEPAASAGFLDALRSVQQINNFEFEAAKKVLSPGFIAPLVTTELFSPMMSPSNSFLHTFVTNYMIHSEYM
uniref:BPI2 domain-containing protein n=1 Tax=Heterorhabditis bacteriophora TaxID=37862 RepID=A0A1I7XTU8_HETBA